MKKNLLWSLLFVVVSAMGTRAATNGIPDEISQGNILHCFNWSAADIKAELPAIAAAGFGSIQMSPLQRPDVRSSGTSWHDLYRPYDLAFKSSNFCSEADLKSLCEEASKYNIKIIVDVVANHVDRTAGYHDTWWDASGRVRWNGNINYNDRYSITHGQLGDYGDVNSEDANVIARGKAYVEKLKSLGVKGIRWDAAKHIGLPSEGCNFWNTVTSVPGVWHYGEILDNPGPNASIIREYTQYMSVTDNQYCNAAARYNGGIPTSASGSHVANQGCSESKMVYWAESHDTYSNDEWSQNVDQSVIDRAYAAFASRNAATCLYLARPNTKGFGNIKTGKGSVAFKNKHIAEVNKFRNAMIGRPDRFESNGNACVVTRQNGGAVIVMKGSGNISISNSGSYCPTGTFTDRVSGNTFTVTSSTISGKVGSSGIAVIYRDGDTPDPDPIPDPDPDPDGEFTIYYDNSATNWSSVNIHYWSSPQTSWPGVSMTKVEANIYKYTFTQDPSQLSGFLFCNADGTAQTADYSSAPAKNHIYKGAGGTKGAITDNGIYNQENPVPDPDPDNDFIIYYDNTTSRWGGVNIHYWSSPQTTWPGVSMTRIEGNIYKYTFAQDPSQLSGFLFCNTDGTDQTADHSSAPVNRHLYKGSGNKGGISDMGVYTEPSGADTIILDPDSDQQPVYYNLQGVPVDNPTPGLYLRRQGSTVSKVIVR